jgi:hypothetical protein
VSFQTSELTSKALLLRCLSLSPCQSLESTARLLHSGGSWARQTGSQQCIFLHFNPPFQVHELHLQLRKHRFGAGNEAHE